MTVEIANRLVTLRKGRGFSQEELAEQLGLSRQAVSKWERAESSPDTDNLILIARLYGISLDELLLTKQDAFKSLVNEKINDNDSSMSTAQIDNNEEDKDNTNHDYNTKDDINWVFGNETTDTEYQAKNAKSTCDDYFFSDNDEEVKISWEGIYIKDKEEEIKIGWDGIHIKDNEEEVKIGWDGIHIKGNNEEVRMGWDGIHFKQKDDINISKKNPFGIYFRARGK